MTTTTTTTTVVMTTTTVTMTTTMTTTTMTTTTTKAVALGMTVVVGLYFKFLKPAHEGQQMIVVFFFSYLSFELADALYVFIFEEAARATMLVG
jgi:hypothetical protein